MKDLFFCIPSYKRSHKTKTLDYLEEIGIPKEKIIVSVQTIEDLHDYKSAGIDCRVGEIIYREADCAAGNRNTCLQHFPDGTKIVLLEDDVQSVVKLRFDKVTKKYSSRKITEEKELYELCEKGFRLAQKYRTCAFGLNMWANATFMRNTYSLNKMVHTGFLGMIKNDLRFDEALKLYDDPDMCCQVVREYGTIICIDAYAAVISRGAEGGCHEAWRDENLVREMYKRVKKKNWDLCTFGTLGDGETIQFRKELQKWRQAR